MAAPGLDVKGESVHVPGWGVPGIVPTHLYPPTAPPGVTVTSCYPSTDHRDMRLRSTKEILGVDNARGTLRLCQPLAATLRLSSPAPPLAPSPVYLRYISGISQEYLYLRNIYISGISQEYLYLRYISGISQV